MPILCALYFPLANVGFFVTTLVALLADSLKVEFSVTTVEMVSVGTVPAWRQYYLTSKSISVLILLLTVKEIHLTNCKLESGTILIHQHFHSIEVEINTDAPATSST